MFVAWGAMLCYQLYRWVNQNEHKIVLIKTKQKHIKGISEIFSNHVLPSYPLPVRPVVTA